MSNLLSQKIKTRARGRWADIVGSLTTGFESAIERPGHHVRCPVHVGQDGDGLRLFRDFPDTGGGICGTCGARPDGIDLIQWANGWSFKETIKAIADWLDGHDHAMPAPRAQTRPKVDNRRRRNHLRGVIKGALPLTHPAAARILRAYLHSRSIDPDAAWERLVASEGFWIHPKLWYFERNPQGKPEKKGRYPALLSLVRNPAGIPVTLHRTWLAANGAGKAPVAKPRKLMAYPEDSGLRISGGAVRIGEPSPDGLGIAEGFETALAASILHGIPVWAVTSNSLLRGWVPPSSAPSKRVVLFGDNDPAGREAVEVSAKALHEAEFAPEIATPDTPGDDWNDVLRKEVCHAVGT